MNMGVHQAAIYSQRAANFLLGRDAGPQSVAGVSCLAEDGETGKKTLAAIHAVDSQEYYRVLCELSEAYYRHIAAVNPAQEVNLNGWLKRAHA